MPWIWSLYFTANDLRLNKFLSIECLTDFGNKVEEKDRVKASESIIATLHSGTCTDGSFLENEASFSMFGTDRKTSYFRLHICKLDEGVTNEYCNLWGSVSYTYQCDFSEETTDDTIELYIGLLPHRFNDLIEIVRSRNADIVQVRLTNVSGFYSEWSPTIRANQIKILTPGEDQNIVYPDSCNIDPPRLGEVGAFELTITQRVKLNPKQDLRQIDIYKLFEDEDKEVNLKENLATTDANRALLTQLTRNELEIKKLNKPMWIICFLLSLLFLKYFL